VAAGIYAIRHLPSGSIYVGSAKDLMVRKKQHMKGDRYTNYVTNAFSRLLRKYENSGFVFEVLEVVQDLDLLEAAEEHWAYKLGAFHRDTGLNTHPVRRKNWGPRETVTVSIVVSVDEFKDLNVLAAKRKLSVPDFLAALFDEQLEAAKASLVDSSAAS